MVCTLSLHYATKTAFFLITKLIPFILSSKKKKKKSLYLWYNGNMIPNSYPSPQSYIVSYPEKNIQDKVVNLNSWKINFSKYL